MQAKFSLAARAQADHPVNPTSSSRPTTAFDVLGIPTIVLCTDTDLYFKLITNGSNLDEYNFSKKEFPS